MRTAIMQPYFLPYIGYWQLLNAVDTFVVYDDIEYSKKGYFNKNSFLLNKDKKNFTIPLKKDSDFLDVKNRYLGPNSNEQITKILKQIETAYKKAPYFQEVFPLIEEIFKYEDNNLFNYNYNSIIKIKDFLGIDTNIVISSDLGHTTNLNSQERVIEINKILNSFSYVNSINGAHLYNHRDFKQENIELEFFEPIITEYSQGMEGFVSHLSIIDVLMYNSKDNVKSMLEQYKILEGEIYG